MSLSNELHKKTAAEVRQVQVDFQGKLDTGETLTGTPTATPDSGITAGTVTKNSSEITVNGTAVPANKGLQFTVSGGTLNTTYNILLSCGTTGSQTLNHTIRVLIVS